jgi:hypothetical protein
VSPAIKAAFAEGKHQLQLEKMAVRHANDPTRNGRPHEALAVPKPELDGDFSWWCSKLEGMMASKLRDNGDYIEVIDEIADRCMRFMPVAHRQARAKVQEDRGGTTKNDALPKYARWLLERGLAERAATVCHLSIEHRIAPTSPGAFEREVKRAEKKLASGSVKARS